MKAIVRAFVFSLIALKGTLYIIDAFVFEDGVNTMLLVLVGLTLLYFFIRPVLAIVSLPTDGVGFLFLTFTLTFVILYILTLFISSFSIRATTISDLVLFGFVLPAKDLTSIWSAIFSALMLSLIFTFFDWLCARK
ncbi:hypothetical protein OAL67_00765 [bacterium]|nr:hypothetical protein [bacterium]